MAVCAAVAWFGVFTFVNQWITVGLGHPTRTWTTVSLYFVAGTVFWQVLSTEISLRLGRRTVLLVAMGVTSTTFLAMPWLTHLPLLKCVLFGLGMMQAFFISAWFPMVVGLGGGKPGRAIAAFQLLNNLATVAMLVVGGQLLQRLGFRVGFLTLGSACLVSTLGFALGTRGLGRGAAGGGATVSLFRLRGADVRRLLVGPFILVLLLGVAIEPLHFHTVNQLFPNLADQLHHLDKAQVGTIVGLGRLPALLSLLIMARVVDHVRPGLAYGAGIMVAACGVLVMGFAAGTTVLVLGYLLYYTGHGTVWGSNGAAVNACVGGRLRDVAFSLMSLTLTASAALVGVLHNALVGAGVALDTVFTICAAGGLAGGLLLIVRTLFSGRAQSILRNGNDSG
ncbi:MAG: MFS transporter [Planctomycetota bacterium]